ncbi:hypothetical protein DWY36_16480 [Firmicutes bacterium AF25-13AC]|nr:hypothetical protein DWY36_16480 [Firmicutes bacterium AF25-13AC]
MEVFANVKVELGSLSIEDRFDYYKAVLKDLTIFHDIFMRNVFKQKECTEYVLQIIMGKRDLKVIDQVIQMDFKNLQGRSAIMDCVALDNKGKKYDIEIQQAGENADPKRARYYSGLMDMNTIDPGEDFTSLPESYVIFITRDDTLGYDKPIYHIDRIIREVEEDFKDESHIIYVNSSRRDNTELGRLMRDLHCKDSKDIQSSVLAQRVFELKETQKGVETMCREMDQIYAAGAEFGETKGLAKGVTVGELKKAKEIALKMYIQKRPVEEIASLLEVPVDTVREWVQSNS